MKVIRSLILYMLNDFVHCLANLTFLFSDIAFLLAGADDDDATATMHRGFIAMVRTILLYLFG